ncbi:VRR-NUC domain-containing protein [Biformimicrobium ophioploci]|uniref:phosphodiesterase I n=1 Tax=Biformimicrobium ophioploci TaxID=3036711 RepID=A0ABQ6LWD0_9GAMM|nr:VRR-NUC domain-containing protein [Microbulbifer sp. NKW57]GMG86411.1 nuclease Fan1 [Microbulbifer sp. NKW57]
MSTPDLPPDYYFRNFCGLVDHVRAHHDDLLNDTERHQVSTLRALPAQAQMRYVRMLMRRGNLFRLDRLQYAEIADTAQSAQTLEAAGLVRLDPDLPVEAVAGLYSKPEWLHTLADKVSTEQLRALRALKRAELDAELRNIYSGDRPCLPSTIIELRQPAWFDTFKLLYFGNLHQDLTEFVLRDLGLYRFENYRIDRDTRLIENREQLQELLDYYRLRDLREEVLAGQPEGILEYENSLQQLGNGSRLLCKKVERDRLALARQLERLDAPAEAVTLYERCMAPPARERRARLMSKAGEIGASLKLCGDMLASPRSEEEQFFAADFGYRTARKNKLPWPQPQKYIPPDALIRLDQDEYGVEAGVAAHLDANGECHYVENTLFGGIFGLYYWDLIFAPAAGAFTNPFQYRPHDLYETDFLSLRGAQWRDPEVDFTRPKQLADELIQRWQEKQGIANPFVAWEMLSPELIQSALERIPAAHWAAVFSRIWRAPRENRSGLPDLIFFPADGGYELLEVKGPGDRLQKNQLRWMQHFEAHQIPHKVINVEWR